MPLILTCPGCGIEINAPPMRAGYVFSCPSCRAPITVPGLPVAALIQEPIPPAPPAPDMRPVQRAFPQPHRAPNEATLIGIICVVVMFVLAGTMGSYYIAWKSDTRPTIVTKDGDRQVPEKDATLASPIFIAGTAITVLYFLPTAIAVLRSHTNLAGIFVLNLLLGWMILFWILALIWSVWTHAPRRQYHEHFHYRG